MRVQGSVDRKIALKPYNIIRPTVYIYIYIYVYGRFSFVTLPQHRYVNAGPNEPMGAHGPIGPKGPPLGAHGPRRALEPHGPPWAPWGICEPMGPWAPMGPWGPISSWGPMGPWHLHNGIGTDSLQRDKRETTIYIYIVKQN